MPEERRSEKSLDDAMRILAYPMSWPWAAAMSTPSSWRVPYET